MRCPSPWLVLLLATACSRLDPTPPPAPAVASASARAGVIDVPPPVERGAPPPAPPGPRTLAGKKVLHLGDSMVGGSFGLTRALESKLSSAGAKIVRHTKVSETLQSFDGAPTLRDLLRTHDPDIVILNLGANDATVPFPQAYARHVARIARRVGDRECWWIGPPSWKGPDAGLVAVLRDNASPCRFFDSSTLELERTSDGIHPSDRGSARWAEAFWAVFVDATP